MAVNGTPGWDFDVTKMMAAFKVPAFDVEAMLASQRKTIEAMAEANRTAMEGVQAVARRQAEIMQQTAADLQGFWAPVANGKTDATPFDSAAQQTAVMKTMFDKAVANMRELSDLVAKSNGEAAGIVAKRVSEGFDEARSFVAKH